MMNGFDFAIGVGIGFVGAELVKSLGRRWWVGLSLFLLGTFYGIWTTHHTDKIPSLFVSEQVGAE